MAGSTANVRVWQTAEVFAAPVGTAPPTDVATPLVAAWKDLGVLHEDGLNFSQDRNMTEHFGYGIGLIRITNNQHTRKFTLSALEDNPTVFDLRNPGSTAVTAAGVTTRTLKTPKTNPRAFILQNKDGGITRRIVIPNGEVVEIGDSPIKEDEMAVTEMTLVAYAASDTSWGFEITSDPQAVVV